MKDEEVIRVTRLLLNIRHSANVVSEHGTKLLIGETWRTPGADRDRLIGGMESELSNALDRVSKLSARLRSLGKST